MQTFKTISKLATLSFGVTVVILFLAGCSGSSSSGGGGSVSGVATPSKVSVVNTN